MADIDKGSMQHSIVRSFDEATEWEIKMKQTKKEIKCNLLN